MPERLQCEFHLIRYVPDPVRGEFANIGVLLREAGQPAAAHLRFTRDWSRVRCLDADADIALLEALEAEIAARLPNSATDFKPVLSTLEDSLSNSIQITEPRACLATSVAAELDLLMKMYVDPLKVALTRRRTGRAAIAAAMRTEFERAGVWALMRKKIAASIYTQPGDPMKIDCGYRPNGVIKMFHAVSLDADVEAAKVLAWSAPRLHQGVQRIENATLELTAIVEPLRSLTTDADPAPPGSESEATERYRFGVSTLESQQIRVLTTADLARAAAAARLDLRL
ncbi:MAG: DUF3037 domain-containing protein [Acidobacteriaceae bacterium]|jgi:hypothetical protein